MSMKNKRLIDIITEIQERVRLVEDPLEAIKLLDKEYADSREASRGSFGTTGKEERLFMLAEKARIIKRKLRGKQRKDAIRSFFTEDQIYEEKSSYADTETIWKILNLELLPFLVEKYKESENENVSCSQGINEVSKYVFPVRDRSGIVLYGEKSCYKGDKKKAFQKIVLAKMRAPVDVYYSTSNQFFEHAIRVCPQGLESWFLDIVDQRRKWEVENGFPNINSSDGFSKVDDIPLDYVYNFYKRENLDSETKKRAKAFFYRALNRHPAPSKGFDGSLDDFFHAWAKQEPEQREPEINRALERAVIRFLEKAIKNRKFVYFEYDQIKRIASFHPKIVDAASKLILDAIEVFVQEKDLYALNAISKSCKDYCGLGVRFVPKKVEEVISNLEIEDLPKVVDVLTKNRHAICSDFLLKFLFEHAGPDTVDPNKLYDFIKSRFNKDRFVLRFQFPEFVEKELPHFETLIRRLKGRLNKEQYLELFTMRIECIREEGELTTYFREKLSEAVSLDDFEVLFHQLLLNSIGDLSNLELQQALDKYIELAKKGTKEEQEYAVGVYAETIEALDQRIEFELKDVFSSGKIPRPKRRPGDRNGRTGKMFRKRAILRQ